MPVMFVDFNNIMHNVAITFMFAPIGFVVWSDLSEISISVIGDEILKGQVIDSNSHFLCRRLFTLGVDVKKVGTYIDYSRPHVGLVLLYLFILCIILWYIFIYIIFF